MNEVKHKCLTSLCVVIDIVCQFLVYLRWSLLFILFFLLILDKHEIDNHHHSQHKVQED